MGGMCDGCIASSQVNALEIEGVKVKSQMGCEMILRAKRRTHSNKTLEDVWKSAKKMGRIIGETPIKMVKLELPEML